MIPDMTTGISDCQKKHQHPSGSLNDLVGFGAPSDNDGKYDAFTK
jgi:hypothetical protein